MADRATLMGWVIDAIKANHGSAKINDICKYVWENHENELRQAGDIFYTWQYEIRWAGQKLRDNMVLKPASLSPKGQWILT